MRLRKKKALAAVTVIGLTVAALAGASSAQAAGGSVVEAAPDEAVTMTGDTIIVHTSGNDVLTADGVDIPQTARTYTLEQAPTLGAAGVIAPNGDVMYTAGALTGTDVFAYKITYQDVSGPMSATATITVTVQPRQSDVIILPGPTPTPSPTSTPDPTPTPDPTLTPSPTPTLGNDVVILPKPTPSPKPVMVNMLSNRAPTVTQLPASATAAGVVETVGTLVQNPAPGDPGGVPAGSKYSVQAVVEPGNPAGEKVTVGNTSWREPSPSDRQVTVNFPARWVTVEHVSGADGVRTPVTTGTWSELLPKVDVKVASSWYFDVTVDADTPPGTVLTTSATSAGQSLGSTSVVVVPADASPCATVAEPLCATGITKGGPMSYSANTHVDAIITEQLVDGGPSFPVDVARFGSLTVHPPKVWWQGESVPGAPQTLDEIDAYLEAWAVKNGASKKAIGGGLAAWFAGPKLHPGVFTLTVTTWDSPYGLTEAGVVYNQGGQARVFVWDTELELNGPITFTQPKVTSPQPVAKKLAPRPTPKPAIRPSAE